MSGGRYALTTVCIRRGRNCRDDRMRINVRYANLSYYWFNPDREIAEEKLAEICMEKNQVKKSFESKNVHMSNRQ